MRTAAIVLVAAIACRFDPALQRDAAGDVAAGDTTRDPSDAATDAPIDHLVAYYPMDALPMHDATGHGHEGSCAAPHCPTVGSGHDGSGYVFSQARVDVSGSGFATASGTIVGWVELDHPGKPPECPFGKVYTDPNNDDSWQLCYGSAGYFLAIFDGSDRAVDSTYTVGSGEWHQMAIAWTPGTCTLYADGSAVAQQAIAGLEYNAGLVTFGADEVQDPMTMDVPITGRLDELRAYDVALTLGELHGL